MAQQQHQDDHAQRAVEQACAQFHDAATRAQAEQVLIEFRTRAPPAVCRSVLERSTLAEARFHAACGLRESVLREWAALPPGEAAAARMYALDCALALAPAQGPEAAVRSTLLGAVAVLLKRGWCDGDKAAGSAGGNNPTVTDEQLMQEHAAFFSELERRSAQAAQGPAGPAAVRVGLEALEAVVGEFSMGGGGGGGGGPGGSGGAGGGGSASSALGMARERHARCRDELERHFLPAFFTHARRIARESCASGAALRGEDGGSCRAAMRLMAAVLSWDFRHHGDSHNQQGGAAANGAGDSHNAAALLLSPNSCEPGAHWAPLLLDPSTTDWLLALLDALRQSGAGVGVGGDRAQQQLEDTRAAARQLLVALAALSGPGLFPKPPGGTSHPPCGPAALAHLTTVLRGVLPMVHPADAALQAAIAGSGEDELLDACRALAALCANHRAAVLAAASDELVRATSSGGGAPPSPGLFPALEALLRASLEAGGVSHSSASEAWLPDVVEMVLESLGSALAPLLFFEAAAGGSATTTGPDVPPIVVATATRAFAALADAALADAAAGAHEDEDADEEHGAGAALQEEWFARVAALARADPASSFSHLAALIERLQAALMAVPGGGGGAGQQQQQQDPSELLEQLVWAVRMAAHALADSGAGESPLPPDPVLRAAASDGGNGPGAAAVLRLSRALLSVTAMPLQDAARPVCSARLVETAVAGAARWADTYLVGGGGGDEDDDGAPPLPPVLEHAFGLGGGGGAALNSGINGGSNGGTNNSNGGGGAEVLDALSRLAVACLAGGYSGEAALHMAVCRVLLPSLVRRRRACAVLVGRPLDGWRQLCAAFAARDALLAVQLPQKAQRFLAQSLCEAANGLADAQQQAAYVTQLIGPAASELAALAAASPQELATPAAALRACCLLETLRGCALGTLPSTHGAVYAQLSALLPSLLVLHSAFKRRPDVVALLLKLADALVETQVDALPSSADREALLAWSLALLRQYQESQLWQASLQQAAAALREEQLHEQCRDLRAVLSLLTHVTQRGGGGGQEDGNGNNDQQQQQGVAAQVALAGLHIVLPLISVELLRLPKLAGLYYGLLCDLLDAHAATVASLSPPHFASLMVSLEWGLGGGGGGGAAGGGDGNNNNNNASSRSSISNPAVLRCCLEGVAGLGRFAAGLGPSAMRFQQQNPGPASTRAAAQQAAAAALAPHAGGGGGSAGGADASSSSSVVAHFQRVLLTRLLLEDASHDTVELAADALLPLLVAEPAAFARLRDGIVQAAAAAVDRSSGGGGGGGSAAAAANGVVVVAADEGARRAAVGAVSKAMDSLLSWLADDQRRRQLELEQEQREAAASGGGLHGGGGAAAAARMRAVAAERGAQRDFRQLLCSTVANVRGFVGIR